MTKTNNIGVLIHGQTPPVGLPEICQFIENKGFGEIWLAEDYFTLGGMVSTSIALQSTTAIQVGIGIVSAVVRHPAVTAMEAATLAGAFPDRLHLGIGHGAPVWTQQMGVHPKSSLASLRESVIAVRRLLAGETLTENGHFHFDEIKLEHPIENVPIYTGVAGPKSLALSGEVADGTVISVLAGPKYLEWAAGITTEAAIKAGRTAPHLLPTYVLYSVDRDREKARARARELTAFYLEIMVGPLTAPYAVNDEINQMISSGTLADDLPDAWLDWFTVSGEPDECVERIKALQEAGASSVVLTPVPPDAFTVQLELTASEVLPKL